MAITDGDMTNYNVLKKSSIEDYLIKLNNFVDKIEPYLKKEEDFQREQRNKVVKKKK